MARKLLALMALLYFAGVAAGLNVPKPLAETLIEAARELVERIFTPNPLELALRIFLNNARVALLLALLSPLVPVPGLLVLANGVILGIAMVYAAGKASWLAALASVLPHGVVEVPALLYAAAASTAFGLALWRSLLGRERGAWRRALPALAKALAVSLALFALAALIEALVTPAVLRHVSRPPALLP